MSQAEIIDHGERLPNGEPNLWRFELVTRMGIPTSSFHHTRAHAEGRQSKADALDELRRKFPEFQITG